MDNKKVFLTGGVGFIGHHLALRFKQAGYEPVVYDNYSQNILNDWHRAVVNERLKLLREAHIPILAGDARQHENVRKAIMEQQPGIVVHLSATPSMILSNKEPGVAIDNNFVSTRNILETIRTEEMPISRLVYFSSSTVYGDFATESVNEQSPTNPKGIYEAAKLSSELLVKAYHNLIGLPFTIIRPSALYGERCINNRVSQMFIERALLGQSLRVNGGTDEKLDFTYVADTVEGVFLAATKPEGNNEIFNITCGHGEPIVRLIEILKDYVPDIQVEYEERDRMRPKRGKLEIDKAKSLLGYTPKYRLEEGYRKYIEWYLQSPFRELMLQKAAG